MEPKEVYMSKPWLKFYPEGVPEKVDIPEEEPLRQECLHFLKCMSDSLKPLTDGWEGLKVLNILNASQASLNACGKKIQLKTAAEGSGIAGAPNFAAPEYFVHPTAVIDDNVTVGRGSKIWHFSHILSGSKVGEKCNLGQNVMVGPDVIIGNNCKLQNNVSVYQGVTLEDGVFCGPSMVFTNIYNPRAEIRKMDQVRPTRVKKGATIGANATIVCGTTLGRYSFVGAGAVVTRDVPDYAVVYGAPARIQGWVCHCGLALQLSADPLLEESASCSCGKNYQKHAGHVTEVG